MDVNEWLQLLPSSRSVPQKELVGTGHTHTFCELPLLKDNPFRYSLGNKVVSFKAQCSAAECVPTSQPHVIVGCKFKADEIGVRC